MHKSTLLVNALKLPEIKLQITTCHLVLEGKRTKDKWYSGQKEVFIYIEKM